MEFILDEKPATFIVSIGNIKIEYPINQILEYCPNWRSNILVEKILTLDKDIKLNGVIDFFEGIINKKFTFNKENCQTILELGELCGSKQIVTEVQAFINNNQRNIPELMKELIEMRGKHDQYLRESYLSKHYNEMLEYPEILKEIEIPIHYRIVQQALNQKDFNYRGFISFIINSIENSNDREYCSFLSLLKIDDFLVDELEKLQKCPNFDENFIKCKIVNIISMIKENNEKVLKQEEIIKNLQFQINELQKQNKQIFDDINSKFTDLMKTQQNSIKTEVSQQLREQFSNIERIFAENQKIINDKTHKIDEQFKNKERMFANHDNLINEIKHKINESSFDMERKFANQNNINNELKQRINEHSSNMKNKFSDQNNKIDELKQQLNDISSKINDKIVSLKSDIMNEIENEKIKNKNQEYGKIEIEKNYSYLPFSGIISELTKNHGGNINDKGVISISGNRNCNGTFSSLVDYNYSGYSYLSKDDKNSFICFDFKNHYVSLSAYSLKSSTHSNPDYLKSWIIEGSNNKDEWTELDSRYNDNSLCSKLAIKTFQIRNNTTEKPFRFIRIKISGQNSHNTFSLELTNIEFFGKYFTR